MKAQPGSVHCVWDYNLLGFEVFFTARKLLTHLKLNLCSSAAGDLYAYVARGLVFL